jgi:uncharacterized SAM-binding protein YcdF (DUF218 family)
MTYTQPLFTSLLAIAFAALAFRKRGGRLDRPLVPFLALGALFLVSWAPAATLVTRVFESRNPPRLYPAETAEAIVVLSSAVFPPCPPIPTPRLGADTYERCQYAAWLHTHWKPLPVLACGGMGDPEDLPPYSLVMRQALEREGVPPSAIWIEGRSLSTHENAVFGAELLRQKGIRKIVLVTEAYHMPRAADCFRKAGIVVVPAACGYRSYHTFHAEELLPGWEPIAWNEDALHEGVGLAWYWMRGWI